MILLEFNSLVLAETINQRLQKDGAKSYTHVVLCDFDGCTYDVTTVESNKTALIISISWPAFQNLKAFGVENRLKTIYGPLVVAPAAGFDFSLQIDTANPPAKAEEVVKNISLLKRHAFASVFHAAFEALDGKGSVPDLITIPYRRSEALYIKKTDGNRVIVIFSMNFQDKDDIIYSDVFLKELQDTRKQISSAPPVLYSLREPPLEIANVQGVARGEGQGYVSFVIASGAAGSARREQTIDNIMLFRNYLMYHIKCSKAYMHTRMRSRTEALLQVLNRAKMKEKDAEKKTMTGRTFTKK
eukprot:TRINITY_DN26261_c0_g1_i1.p1 TRINITY_DN26261_c0_g1~~TRINITY_DN26261_c0_g1_i1.p1  ORF type:complete len:312 (-),score=73.27 TRINITY_DN26261_c0_g1_i1:50-949(-)